MCMQFTLFHVFICVFVCVRVCVCAIASEQTVLVVHVCAARVSCDHRGLLCRHGTNSVKLWQTNTVADGHLVATKVRFVVGGCFFFFVFFQRTFVQSVSPARVVGFAVADDSATRVSSAALAQFIELQTAYGLLLSFMLMFFCLFCLFCFCRSVSLTGLTRISQTMQSRFLRRITRLHLKSFYSTLVCRRATTVN